MKKNILFLFLFLFYYIGNCQFNTIKLDSLQKEMVVYAEDMLNNVDKNARLKSDSIFTKKLVQALKNPYSFYFTFDSIKQISTIYSPDSFFKIFTWDILLEDDLHIQRGAIQFNTKDGLLKLIPLFDVTNYDTTIFSIVGNNKNWVGAVYYNIILNTYNNKTFYTLLGFDLNNRKSTKKIMEVLYFNAFNIPVFGGDFFDFKDAENQYFIKNRLILEYKKDALVKLNYDTKKNEIFFNYLISENNNNVDKSAFIPEGSLEYLRWEDGKWRYFLK